MPDHILLRARVAADVGGGGPSVLEAVAVRKYINDNEAKRVY